jgi:hypothetical protein
MKGMFFPNRSLRRRAREGGDGYVMLCLFQAYRFVCAKDKKQLNQRWQQKHTRGTTHNIHLKTKANICAPKILILFF